MKTTGSLKNKVQLIGYLGKNPEIKVFDENRKLAQVSLATSEQYKNAKGEKVVDTEWHQLVAWGKVADLFEQYTQKGSEIAIEGKVTYRDYVDANGNKKYITEILVNELLLLDRKTEQ